MFNLRKIFSNFKDIFEDLALDATLSQCLAFKAELRYASSHFYAFEIAYEIGSRVSFSSIPSKLVQEDFDLN